MHRSQVWWKVALYALALAMLACAVWVVRSLDAFGHCIHQDKNYKEYRAFHEQALFVVKFFVRLGLNGFCTAHTANVYQGAITALAGIAVAFFTFALKGSTEKLWRAGRDALEITERAFVVINSFNRQLNTRVSTA